VGQVVNKGDPHAEEGSKEYELFTQGVHAGAKGLVGRSIVGGITTMTLHYLTPVFGDRNMFYFSQAVLAFGYFATFFVPAYRWNIAIAIISLFGIPWGIFMTIPFVIVARISPEDSRGLYVGTMNIFTCLSQLCVALAGPLLVEWVGDYNTTLFALGSGCAFGVLSLVLVAYLDTSSSVFPLPLPLPSSFSFSSSTDVDLRLKRRDSSLYNDATSSTDTTRNSYSTQDGQDPQDGLRRTKKEVEVELNPVTVTNTSIEKMENDERVGIYK